MSFEDTSSRPSIGPILTTLPKHRLGTELRDPSAGLSKTTKCVGIAQIGSVKARDLDTLIALVGDGDNSKGHQAVPRFEGWRCKDWILEMIGICSIQHCGSLALLRCRPDAQKSSSASSGSVASKLGHVIH
ncbi:hypothetical protein C8J57DRAFT_375648 [Mycena rebaudengoi]|nr:hypothetical protein C8J57DRAFT_375648 [Mycena rebaudengoi]